MTLSLSAHDKHVHTTANVTPTPHLEKATLKSMLSYTVQYSNNKAHIVSQYNFIEGYCNK